jgi:predicted acetyltransferase
MDWNLETKVQPVFMGRVVDVEAALRLLGPTYIPNGEFALLIRDETAPWNNAQFRLTIEDKRLYVAVDTTGAPPQVSMDIQAFSQAFWGHPSLLTLRQAGRVSVKGEAAFAVLSTLLPAHPVYTLDDF